MLAPTQNARIERGAGRVAIERVPYANEPAVAALAGLRHLVLVGAEAPVGFFAYPGKPSRLYPEDCQVHVLARPEQDLADALERLADALGARPAPRGEPAGEHETGARGRRRRRLRAEPGRVAAGAGDGGG